jgi:poly-beta-1,6-N-acetyl-D-glucosamine synthase
MVPLLLLVLFEANILIAYRGRVYLVTLAAQLIAYGLAAIGFLLRHRTYLPRVIAIPFYFAMVNFASACGIIQAYRGKTYTTWTTVRARDK